MPDGETTTRGSDSNGDERRKTISVGQSKQYLDSLTLKSNIQRVSWDRN